MSNFSSKIWWFVESTHLEISNKQAPINELSFICSRNKCVIFEIFDDLVTNKALYHVGNMAYDRYWPEVISIINFTFILINKCYPDFFQSSLTIPLSRDELTTYASDFDTTGQASFSNLCPCPKYHFHVYWSMNPLYQYVWLIVTSELVKEIIIFIAACAQNVSDFIWLKCSLLKFHLPLRIYGYLAI